MRETGIWVVLLAKFVFFKYISIFTPKLSGNSPVRYEIPKLHKLAVFPGFQCASLLGKCLRSVSWLVTVFMNPEVSHSQVEKVSNCRCKSLF